MMDLTLFDHPFLFGSDLSSRAIEISAANARRAGVESFIRFRQGNLSVLTPDALTSWTGFERHLVICNPPYGERMLDSSQAEAIYRIIGQNFLDCGQVRAGIRLSVITPHEQFETIAGGCADKRRKLYNGMIRCTLHHYFKTRRTST